MGEMRRGWEGRVSVCGVRLRGGGGWSLGRWVVVVGRRDVTGGN